MGACDGACLIFEMGVDMYKIYDLHCDTVHKIGDDGMRRIPGAHVDLLRLRDAGYGLMTFAAFVNTGYTEDPYGDCLRLLSALHREIEANGDIAAPVLCADDIMKNEACGRVSALLSVEEGAVIEDEISRVSELYDLGVRMMTFTWNYDNDIATSSRGTGEGGLTPFGREFLAELERVGIIADVSHLSDAGFYDVAKASARPFIASHSNARAVCAHERNLTDDMIRIVGRKGGIVGLNFCAPFIGGDGGLEMLCRHARELADCGGIECVALGGDFDGIPDNPALPDCTATPRLADAFRDFGFTSREVDLIMGGNARRFLCENL